MTPLVQKILLIEDDPVFEQRMVAQIQADCPSCEVTVLRTEEEFRRDEAQLAGEMDFFIIDIWLPWTEPSRGMTLQPPDVRLSQGNEHAGFRCMRRLLDRPLAAKKPIVLYSVLSYEDVIYELPISHPNVSFVRKDPTSFRRNRMDGSEKQITRRINSACPTLQ